MTPVGRGKRDTSPISNPKRVKELTRPNSARPFDTKRALGASFQFPVCRLQLTPQPNAAYWPVPTPKPNRGHPCLLPDDYLRKLKQDLSEVEAQVESETHYVPDPDFSPAPSDDDFPPP